MQIQYEHLHYHVEKKNAVFILSTVGEIIQFEFINI